MRDQQISNARSPRIKWATGQAVKCKRRDNGDRRGGMIGRKRPIRCPYQKLHPTVLVVQATEDGHRNDPPDPVDRSMDWGVFVERQVSPEFVVVRDVGCDDAAEMS